MKEENIKTISAIGIISAILLFVADSGLALYNFGCDVVSHGSECYERFSFNWNSIEPRAWAFWGLGVLWYAVLVIPWIQFFIAAPLEGRFRRTLAANDSFLSVFFTVFNVSLIIGSTIWFFRTGSPDGFGLCEEWDDFWRDLILVYVLALSPFYIISAMIVMVNNALKARKVRREEAECLENDPLPFWCWIVAALPFLFLALTVADARWEFLFF